MELGVSGGGVYGRARGAGCSSEIGYEPDGNVMIKTEGEKKCQITAGNDIRGILNEENK